MPLTDVGVCVIQPYCAGDKLGSCSGIILDKKIIIAPAIILLQLFETGVCNFDSKSVMILEPLIKFLVITDHRSSYNCIRDSAHKFPKPNSWANSSFSAKRQELPTNTKVDKSQDCQFKSHLGVCRFMWKFHGFQDAVNKVMPKQEKWKLSSNYCKPLDDVCKHVSGVISFIGWFLYIELINKDDYPISVVQSEIMLNNDETFKQQMKTRLSSPEMTCLSGETKPRIDTSSLKIPILGNKGQINFETGIIEKYEALCSRPKVGTASVTLSNLMGTKVLVIGSPFGSMCPEIFMNSVSIGVISNTAGGTGEMLLTDARYVHHYLQHLCKANTFTRDMHIQETFVCKRHKFSW